MVTVVCDKTGVEFEAKSKRQKNHPKVSELLNNASRYGGYRTALDVMAQCKAEGMTDIDAILARVQAAMAEEAKAQDAATDERERDRKEYEARRRAAFQDRQETNTILSDGGYKWADLGIKDEEDADFTNFGAMPYGHDWQLFAGDRAVSVLQAMQEMADSGNVRAKRWLEEHPI